MGQNRWADDVKIRRKRTSSLFDLRVHCPEECLRAKVVENCRYTIAPTVQTIETVFRTIISVNQLSLYGAVAEMCEENESCHERTGGPVVRGQSSPSFVPSVIKTNILLIDGPAHSMAKIHRTSGKALTTRPRNQILYWCRIPENSWSRTVFHDERHWRTLTIHRISGLSWVHFVKMKNIWSERSDSREHQNWARVGSHNQLLVEIRVESVNKDNSHSWVRISRGLDELVTDLIDKEDDDNEQETSEMQFEEYALKMECRWFCKSIKGQSKTTKTYFGQLIHENFSCWGQNLDWYWTTEIFSFQLSSVEETDQSSSSWKSTSGQWWSDWILEDKRLSSGSFCFLSSLVWRKVEEHTRKDVSLVLILQEQLCIRLAPVHA